MIDGKAYSYLEKSNLPHNLSIQVAKLVQVEDGVAFQGKHALLSNHHPCRIHKDGKDFSSSEQQFHFRGLPLITYASRWGGGVNTNAYKSVQGGRGGLNMTKNTHLYAGLLKVLQYLKHLRIDNSDFCMIRLRFTFWM